MKTARILFALAMINSTVLATAVPNYSGTYNLRKPKSSKSLSLSVVQTEYLIEVNRESDGKSIKTRVPLDGSAVECTTFGGTPGKCRAQLDGAGLMLESNVFTRPDPKSPIVRMHATEKWQLSPDGKSLTITYQVDSPQISPEILRVVAPENPWKETFERVN